MYGAVQSGRQRGGSTGRVGKGVHGGGGGSTDGHCWIYIYIWRGWGRITRVDLK